jgi:peroxiredoxin Q/BCP
MSLKPGDKVPDFALPTGGNGKVSLSKVKGETVILYFHPKDDTSGCTTEACGLRDSFPKFGKSDAMVIGISRDSVASHDKFKRKYDLPFTIASDEDGKVCEAFGTHVEKSMYGQKYMGIERATFLIGGKGAIRNI